MSDHCIYREKTEYCHATCPCLGVEQDMVFVSVAKIA